MKKLLALSLFVVFLVQPPQAQADNSIKIVAAENFYGNVAQQIGGLHVVVTSILSNPDQDPHLFEASASVAKGVSTARIVVYSGLDYDPWMEKLLNATSNPDRRIIVVAGLVDKKPGDNPHIWYDAKTMLAYAEALADNLAGIDPANQADYQKNLVSFQNSIQPIGARVAVLHDRLSGRPVTATEPVFGYMFDALGMDVRNKSFQLSVMNNTEPSASDVAGFESDLRTHKVILLVYNSQASDPIAVRMEKIARTAHIPVVGAAETEPAGKNYQEWMLDELSAVDHALPE